jgi:hypothetical protein
MHVDRVELARAAPALGDAAEDLVGDPVALVLEVADLGGQLRPVRVGDQQVAQEAGGLLDVAPGRLEEGEQPHVGLRPHRPHDPHRNPGSGCRR